VARFLTRVFSKRNFDVSRRLSLISRIERGVSHNDIAITAALSNAHGRFKAAVESWNKSKPKTT